MRREGEESLRSRLKRPLSENGNNVDQTDGQDNW